MNQGIYRTYIFERTTTKGEIRYYCRFFAQDGLEVTTRSLGRKVANRHQAEFAVVSLIRILDLEQLETAKRTPVLLDYDEDAGLRVKEISTFIIDFWTNGSSEYLESEKMAGRPLSSEYVATRRRYAERFVLRFPPFRAPLHTLTFRMVERFIRHLREELHLDGNKIEPVVRSLQKPVSWATSRGLLDTAFDWKAISLPKTSYSPRGILDWNQVNTLLNLPVSPMRLVGEGKNKRPLVVFRKRLPGSERNRGPGPLDIRMKAALGLALLTGLRKGEIRGLTWECIDFENQTITICSNYVRFDGLKGPKSGSTGIVPISEPLKVILLQLKKTAIEMERFAFDGWVLFNTNPTTPISDSMLQRGFYRALAHLGLGKDDRNRLNLKFHGSRHFFATVLADELGSAKASRMTRHSTAAAFEDYAKHTTKEALLEANGALTRVLNGGQGDKLLEDT